MVFNNNSTSSVEKCIKILPSTHIGGEISNMTKVGVVIGQYPVHTFYHQNKEHKTFARRINFYETHMTTATLSQTQFAGCVTPSMEKTVSSENSELYYAQKQNGAKKQLQENIDLAVERFNSLEEFWFLELRTVTKKHYPNTISSKSDHGY